MSEIRDKCHPSPVKSRPVWGTGFPVMGKKFVHFRSDLRSSFFTNYKQYSNKKILKLEQTGNGME
jgi:hypothetical protein